METTVSYKQLMNQKLLYLLNQYKKKGEANGSPKRPGCSCTGLCVQQNDCLKKGEVHWESTVTQEGKIWQKERHV